MKDFVPYKESLELKELRFNEPCFAFYNLKNQLKQKSPTTPLERCINYDGGYGGQCTAPTFSQAFRFFREKYGDYLLYSFGVIPHFTIIQNLIFEDSKITYEEAELECLKKLIEIVKNK